MKYSHLIKSLWSTMKRELISFEIDNFKRVEILFKIFKKRKIKFILFTEVSTMW